MKKKGWIILLISPGVLYLVTSLTGVLQSYHTSVGSGEPAINPGDRLLASNLLKPKRFDLICFKQAKSKYWDGGIWVMRFCGLPGDKIQLIDGVLFVNGQNTDSFFDLKKNYIVPASEVKKLDEEYYRKHQEDIIQRENPDSFSVSLEASVFRNKGLTGRLDIRTDTISDIQRVYGH